MRTSRWLGSNRGQCSRAVSVAPPIAGEAQQEEEHIDEVEVERVSARAARVPGAFASWRALTRARACASLGPARCELYRDGNACVLRLGPLAFASTGREARAGRGLAAHACGVRLARLRAPRLAARARALALRRRPQLRRRGGLARHRHVQLRGVVPAQGRADLRHHRDAGRAVRLRASRGPHVRRGLERPGAAEGRSGLQRARGADHRRPPRTAERAEEGAGPRRLGSRGPRAVVLPHRADHVHELDAARGLLRRPRMHRHVPRLRQLAVLEAHRALDATRGRSSGRPARVRQAEWRHLRRLRRLDGAVPSGGIRCKHGHGDWPGSAPASGSPPSS